ncbi:MAG: shikimate dehydrogenase [Conexivisphaerales archaeon]
MRNFALVGRNVKGSASPAMMKAAFSSLGIDADYKLLNISEVEFESSVADVLRSYSGINVTMPYKSAILPYIQSTDAGASRIGAVNTIKVNGKTEGFNTDVLGILEPLRREKIDPGRAILLGTGGAARAFCLAMEGLDCREITVWDRNRLKSESFVNEMRRIFPSIRFSTIRLEYTSSYDLLFNATPMGGIDAPLQREIRKLVELVETVFDSVYFPIQTELVRIGREAGCKTIEGYEMLLHQGAGAVRIWLNAEPPLGVMRESVLRFLKEREQAFER